MGAANSVVVCIGDIRLSRDRPDQMPLHEASKGEEQSARGRGFGHGVAERAQSRPRCLRVGAKQRRNINSSPMPLSPSSAPSRGHFGETSTAGCTAASPSALHAPIPSPDHLDTAFMLSLVWLSSERSTCSTYGFLKTLLPPSCPRSLWFKHIKLGDGRACPMAGSVRQALRQPASRSHLRDVVGHERGVEHA